MAGADSVMVEAINRALQQALATDERVVVMGQDVGRLGGVFRATDGLQARFGSQRVFDTPLAESAIVGTAFGMALTGLRPVTEIQFMVSSTSAPINSSRRLARSEPARGARPRRRWWCARRMVAEFAPRAPL